MAAAGISHLWLPPPSRSVSPEGYMPGQVRGMGGCCDQGSMWAGNGVGNRMHNMLTGSSLRVGGSALLICCCWEQWDSIQGAPTCHTANQNMWYWLSPAFEPEPHPYCTAQQTSSLPRLPSCSPPRLPLTLHSCMTSTATTATRTSWLP